MNERSNIIQFPLERRGVRPERPKSPSTVEFDYSMQLLREAMERAGEPFPDTDPRRAALATLAMRVCDLVLEAKGASGRERMRLSLESQAAMAEYDEMKQQVKGGVYE